MVANRRGKKYYVDINAENIGCSATFVHFITRFNPESVLYIVFFFYRMPPFSWCKLKCSGRGHGFVLPPLGYVPDTVNDSFNLALTFLAL